MVCIETKHGWHIMGWQWKETTVILMLRQDNILDLKIQQNIGEKICQEMWMKRLLTNGVFQLSQQQPQSNALELGDCWLSRSPRSTPAVQTRKPAVWAENILLLIYRQVLGFTLYKAHFFHTSFNVNKTKLACDVFPRYHLIINVLTLHFPKASYRI